MSCRTETMQIVTCDRCKKSVRSLEKGRIHPSGWDRFGNDVDMCSTCAPALREWMGWDPLPARNDDAEDGG